MEIRICQHNDSSGAVAVVRAVHVEYGFTWDEHGYHRDLYDVQQYYFAGGGRFWEMVDGGRVVGCVGVSAHGRECELHRMYLLQECRGRGWGRHLLGTALAFGRERGFERMIAWSDVKLADAHRMYRAAGFVQDGERICDDPDQSREYGFWKAPI